MLVTFFGLSPIDVDECTKKTHECSNKNGCRNTQGSYTCTCETGYYLDSDQRTCKGLLILIYKKKTVVLLSYVCYGLMVNFTLLFQTLMSAVHIEIPVVTMVIAKTQ